MLKINKTTTYEIVTEEGEPIPERVSKYLHYLMHQFMDARVLGEHSELSSHSALRMAEITLRLIVESDYDGTDDDRILSPTDINAYLEGRFNDDMETWNPNKPVTGYVTHTAYQEAMRNKKDEKHHD